MRSIKQFIQNNLIQIIIYSFLYLLFVYKYSSPTRPNYELVPALFLVVAPLVVFLFLKFIVGKISFFRSKPAYWSVVILLVVTLTILMKQYDPQTFVIGRIGAVNFWVEHFWSGQFPYDPIYRPSSMPTLFYFATPFYYLGDPGYMQIFSLLVLAYLIQLKETISNQAKFAIFFIVALSPLFIFELLVRSDIVSNMILGLLAVKLIVGHEEDSGRLVLIGIVGGLVLATRTVIMFPLIFALFYFLKEFGIKTTVYLSLIIIGTFGALIVPFIIWNYDGFMTYGPFAVQGSYIPLWLSAMFFFGAVVLGYFIKGQRSVYRNAGAYLFGIVFIAFIISVIQNGFDNTINNDYFDAAYFCFCLPFIAYSIDA